MRCSPLLFACLLWSAPALSAPSPLNPPPCQPQGPERGSRPQGTLLWGTTRLDDSRPQSAILVSTSLKGARLATSLQPLPALQLQEGTLSLPTLPSGGVVLRGTASDGSPVDVAVCAAERSGEQTLYTLEVRREDSAQWVNPCVPSAQAPSPRALAVPGVWDATGARKDTRGLFTFACELGAIAKCSQWGYQPWEPKLADLHQACTRMARADYCGDGQSHTRDHNVIDVYDAQGHVRRETRESQAFSPARASFEAAWRPDGAWCLARTRGGTPLEEVMRQCPQRFERREEDLGDGDVCTLTRGEDTNRRRLVHNRSYGPEMKATRAPALTP